MYVCIYVSVPDFFQVDFHVGYFEHELDVLVRIPNPVEQRLHSTRDDALAHFAMNVALHSVCLPCKYVLCIIECMYCRKYGISKIIFTFTCSVVYMYVLK